jgi:hypothetical protein
VDSKNPEQTVQHKLATEKYQVPGDEIHPMCSFMREDLRNYKDSNVDILNRQRSLKYPEFMTVPDEDS